MRWTRYSKPAMARRLLVALPFALLMLFVFHGCGPNISLPVGNLLKGSCISGTEHISLPEVQLFWRTLGNELHILTPDLEPIVLEEKATKYDQSPDLENDPHHRRLDLIKLPYEAIKTLQGAHDAMVNLSQTLAPALPYRKHTRGIVTTAGGKYFGIVVVSLRMLRRSGSRLPVIVLLDTHADYDALVCEEIFAALNAECVILSYLLDFAPPSIPLKTYQYKVFALLFTPFQETLFMDADAFPAHNPDELFGAEPYKSTGLVTWPDFWANTASPILYEIARFEAPSLAARKSSEAGILLYDKKRHAPDLLLALVYNFLGPDWFYPLLSQGAEGQGDKETFLHAAMALNASYYDVKSPLTVLGRWLNGTWQTAGVKQVDPREDWALNWSTNRVSGRIQPRATQTVTQRSQPKFRDNEATFDSTTKTAKPLFIHNNIVKLDIEKLIEPGSPLLEEDETGHWQRLWGSPESLIDEFGYDVESVLWREMAAAGCQTLTTRDCKKVLRVAESVLGEEIPVFHTRA
ncbi:alpha-mannosyltransferase [Xylariales sp. AK1849]|nr:alpha-mannosyltransferase [Xylariales sp. AK1849]